MKKLLGLAAASLLMVGQAGMAFADTRTFTMSASIPAATSINMTPTSINSTSGARTAVSGDALSFNPMTFNSTSQTWLPDHYFSVDVSPAGPGNADTTVSYTEGANPNAPNHGLGWKSTATFMKVVGSTETALSSHGPKKMLKDLASEHITPAEVSGGFLRVYLGVVSKDPAAAIPDPAASELFTNADRPGAYDGTLTFTATVV